MRVAITMINDTTCSAEFIGCNSIEDVRTWLNSSGPFITIGPTVIINAHNVLRIREDVQNDT